MLQILSFHYQSKTFTINDDKLTFKFLYFFTFVQHMLFFHNKQKIYKIKHVQIYNLLSIEFYHVYYQHQQIFVVCMIKY